VQVLNIQGLDKLTDAGLAHVAANNTELRDLDMQSCSAEITRKAIKKLVRRASGLRRLILKFCRPVDDSVLRVIGDSLGTTQSHHRERSVSWTVHLTRSPRQAQVWRWSNFRAVRRSKSLMPA
jgi:hypothetical protein